MSQVGQLHCDRVLLPFCVVPPKSAPLARGEHQLTPKHIAPHGVSDRVSAVGRCCAAGDVYYFCGSRMQYCTCSYRWNLAGWGKAAVLWAFVLSTVFGMQRLLVELVLQGLLPGEPR